MSARPILVSLLLATSLAMVLVPRQAQAEVPPKVFYMGAKAGLHSAYIEGIPRYDSQGHQQAFRTASAAVGFLVHWRIFERLGIEGGMYYVGRGYEQRGTIYGVPQPEQGAPHASNDVVMLTYMQLEALVSVLPLGWLGPVAPRINLGVYGASLSRSNLNQYDTNPVSHVPVRSDTLAGFDYGAIVAVGMDFDLDDLVMTVEFRYELGLADINVDPEVVW